MKMWWKRYREMPEKWIFWGMLLVFLGSMAPVWYLSRYTVMGCDDYYYGIATHQAWLASHSFGAVLRAALSTTVEYWHNWQGTYSSIFLMTLAPGVIEEKAYFLTVFLMTGILIAGVAALGHVFLKYYAGCQNRWLRGTCVLMLLFLAVQTMVSPADGIFWYNGALHYMFMESVLYLLTAALLAYRVSEGRGKRILYLLFAALLGFVCGGANLLTALQSLLVYGVCLLGDLVLTKKRKNLWLGLPFLVTLGGFLLNVLAPGNAIREGTAESMGAIPAIALSLYWALVFLADWMTPLVIAGFLFLLPVIFRCTRDGKHSFVHPLLALLVSYCVFAAMFTPTLYAMSSEGPDRCKNIMRVTLYLLVFANLVNWAGFVQKKGRMPVWIGSLQSRFAAWMPATLCLVLFLFLFTADKNTYTSVSALRSIVNGEAAQYYAQNETRLEAYNDSSQKEVTVQPLTARPYLLFKTDVGNEGSEDYWVTLAIERYYQKDRVWLEE